MVDVFREAQDAGARIQMAKQKLREAIAAEAARLILRGKETEYVVARKRAARWRSRRKVAAQDIPGDAEIQSQLYTLAGLFSHEHQTTALYRMRTAALELMQLLKEFRPRLAGCAIDGPVLAGSEITIRVWTDTAKDVVKVLGQAGIYGRLLSAAEPTTTSEEVNSPAGESRIHLHHGFGCEITVFSDHHSQPTAGRREHENPIACGLDIAQLERLIAGEAEPDAGAHSEERSAAADEHEYHPDAFSIMRMLVARLENVQLDAASHPEGDALYHSLQVYELGFNERPYDEEFLLACLLHDVGRGIDRRNPVRAAIHALDDLLTRRTCFLIEHRPEAVEYLKTGKIPRSLRRSEHFDDLLLLARCDLDGRIPGAPVRDLDEVLEEIAGLSTAWDDV